MTSTRLFAAGALLCVLTPAFALAHPGHGTTEPAGVLHYLVEPLHLLALLSVVAAAALIVVLRRRARDRSR